MVRQLHIITGWHGYDMMLRSAIVKRLIVRRIRFLKKAFFRVLE